MSGSGVVPVVAIDGPSASGKGSVASRVAARLGFHHLDSGSLYRVVALQCLEAGIDLSDGASVAAVARALDVCFADQRITLSGRDVTDAIRVEACSRAASVVAAHPALRDALLDRQRQFRTFPGLVAEGRDMGTVVFPDAAVKIYLDASAEVRAERRYKQLIDKGERANLATLLEELRARDVRDASRSAAPLQHAPDAVLVDSTHLDLDQSVSAVMDVIRNGAGFDAQE